jgi:protein-S-isoprenylcysteine O-methyltransferase Ste14
VILPEFGIVYRIRVEERELLRRLGESYRRYAARRKRLVPGIW